MTKSKTLGRDAILGASDRKIERVEVPEWGGCVFVRTLRAFERDAFEASMFKGRGKNRTENLENLRARLVVLAACETGGARLFDDADVKALGDKSAAPLDRVFGAAQRLNGMTTEDVEEMVGNSKAARRGATSST